MPISSVTVRRIYGSALLLSVFSLALVIPACNKPAFLAREVHDSIPVPSADTVETIPQDTVKPLAVMELLNEHYGKDSQQVMDIYLPAGRSPDETRIMVFIHGGGWMGSDKRDYTPHIDNMKNRNAQYAYVNINYRLVKDGKNVFPAAEEDINAALAYVWKRVDSFHISPATGLIGTSAGAHLAALQACKHNEKGYIRAAVCLLGVYDMQRFYDEGSAGVPALAAAVLGGTPEQRTDLYRTSSPLFYVSEKTPPTLLIHGTEDTLARYSQALAMDSVLEKAGVVHELYSFKGWHAIPADKIVDAAERMFDFIAKYTK
ncbi:Acetyl esterase/lipase [Chitinophaga sp. YR627]|uniref:alpha/beta hydrolase n=1 Tax=Chitinophaga sp. YR627 TaxID=1881041 RepID=UPI0008EFE01A|nr:alpha/beta hydrolase [Chitinophaga sp. YR627]SFO17767.1 Acetyl esterase/lipase [Chitinophaga sp. YR627]